MDRTWETKRCSNCSGEAIYLHDVDLTGQKLFMDDWTQAALYRCATCGHFDLYEREEDRKASELEEQRRMQYESLPDYLCPICRKVGKSERCPSCGTRCIPAQKDLEAEEAPTPGPIQPEKKKKHRWFGRDPEKPDWEG